MTPETFPAANLTLNAPPEWDEVKDGKCGALPVYTDGEGAFMSQWRPSWRERAAILFGARVRLWLLGVRGHPPVSLSVHQRDAP